MGYSQREQLAWENVKMMGPDAMAEFIRLIEGGETPVMAEMLVSRRPPGLGFGGHTLIKNRPSLLEQFNGSHIVMDHWMREYRRRTGEELPADAVILRSLATETGDPSAVVSHKQSLEDVLSIARTRNLKVTGDVNFDPDPSIPPEVQTIRMGEDLIDRYTSEYHAADPRLREADPREVREMVIENHTEKRTYEDLNPYGATSLAQLAKKVFV